MLKIFILLLLITGSVFKSFSTEDYWISFDSNNIEIKNYTNGRDHYFNYDLNIFMNLCIKYQTKFYANNVLPYIIFDLHLCSYEEKEYYGLSYKKIDFNQTVLTIGKLQNKYDQKTALVISIYGQQLNFKNAIKLLDYGINNLEYVKGNLKNQLIGDFKNTYTGVPFEIIDSILLYNNRKVDEIEREKTFLKSNNDSSSYELRHYYQNDSFHFYVYDPFDKKREIKDILTVKHVHEIIPVSGGYRLNCCYYLIFESDSTFFCINDDKSISTKFTISNAYKRYPSHHSYLIQEHEMIIFDFYASNDILKKIAFFPKKQILIQNYVSRENDFINSLFKSDQIEKKNNSNKGIIFKIIFILSVCINLTGFLIIFFNKKK